MGREILKVNTMQCFIVICEGNELRELLGDGVTLHLGIRRVRTGLSSLIIRLIKTEEANQCGMA